VAVMVALLLVLLVLVEPASSDPTTFTVTSTGDAGDVDTTDKSQ
jgi:preprotein translocase subunit SecG